MTTTETAKTGGWNRAQVKLFAKAIRSNIGEGWRFLTPEIREAVIAQKALGVVMQQAAESVRVEDVSALYVALLQEFKTAEGA